METENKIQIFFPESLTHSSTFSNYAIAVYGALKFLVLATKTDKQCITALQITYLLTGNEKSSKYTNNCISNGFAELEEKNVVTKINETKKHHIIDCSELWLSAKSNKKFTIINFDEVREIFQIQNVNNFTMLRYFIFLVNTFCSQITVYVNADSKSRVVGTYTIEKLSQLSGISVRSIIEYNKLLEDNRLIYIHRQNDFILDEEDHIRQLPNVYGRYCDKAYIDSFAENQKKHQESYRYQEKSIVKVNDNRRLAQMYNQILKGYGERYSESEISDIYSYVLTQNEKYERLYDKYSKEEYLDKIRDTDIFIQYGF